MNGILLKFSLLQTLLLQIICEGIPPLVMCLVKLVVRFVTVKYTLSGMLHIYENALRKVCLITNEYDFNHTPMVYQVVPHF